MIFSLLLVTFGAMAVTTAEAQRRSRAVIIYHRPYWNHWGYDPYYYDPYYREARERYYLESRARGNQNELEKHKEKYYADGVLTAKERRELADDEKDYNNSVRRLNRYNRRY